MKRGGAALAVVLLLMLGIGKKAKAVATDLGRAPALSMGELRSLAAAAGFTGLDLNIAVAVAMAESGGHPEALGDAGASYGLWQVNIPSHPEYKLNPEVLYTPAVNAEAAFKIKTAGGWVMWSTYTHRMVNGVWTNVGPGKGVYLDWMPGGSKYQ